MANSNPVWHNIFRNIVLKPDNITFEAESYKDTLNILRGPGVAWQGYSDEDTALSTGNDTFMINVDYDISIPLATTDLSLEDVNGNTSVVTFTAGRGVEIIRNSAQELEWRSYSVTETDTLQTVTERNNITNNKIFVNNIEVGTISSSFTEDGFPSYDAGHNLIGDGTLDSPLEFSPEYQDSLMANNTDQFEFTALGPGTLAYSASYVCDSGATTASVTLEREDPSSPGTWVVLDVVSGVTIGYSYAIQGIYAELYSGNVNYRLTYTWTGNLGVVTWHVQNTFEGGAYTPITSPQLKTDTDAKTVEINDLLFFQNNIRTTVSNTDIVLDPAGTGNVVALSNIVAPTFTGDLTGNVNGNVNGNVTGNIISTNTSLTVVNTSAPTTVFTGNLTGNADTVTNGVYTSGSYADPSWITSLDAAKIVGSIQLSDITIDGDLRLFDNVISTSLSNSDIVLDPNGTGKVRSFSNIVAPVFEGDLTGNANTVTNGVYTTGLYADPSWITSLDAAKIIGDIQLRSFVIDDSIRIDGTLIETIVSNANLELKANGTGVVYISNGLTVSGTLTANSTVGLSPNNAAVTISPTGTGTVTINPATAGTINNMVIGGTTASAGTFTQIVRSGNVSASAWGTTGIGIRTVSGTFTDTSSGAGTVANAQINVLSIPTIAASNSITITNASTLYIAGPPLAGTNVVDITNQWALNVAGGAVYLAGPVVTGSALTVANNLTAIGSNGVINLSPTGTGTVTINPTAASTMNNVTITVPAGTTTVAPFRMSSGTDLTSVTAGAMEYDGTVVKFTGNTNIGRAPIQQMVFTSGISASSGVTVVASTNYALFPAANDTITLPVGTYMVQTMFRVDTSAAVSNALSFTMLGAGGATCTFIGQASATNTTSLPANVTQTRIASAAANAITIAVATATQRVVYITGVLRVTTQGTVIPSIQFNGLAGTMTFYADNYMVLSPLSNSGSTASTSGWG